MSISLQLSCVHDPMRAVFDTDVMAAGIGSATGASRKRLHLVEAGRFEIVQIVAVVLEYESVLKTIPSPNLWVIVGSREVRCDMPEAA